MGVKWITWSDISEDVIYVIPDDFFVHTISCIEQYSDKEKGITGIKVKSKNYYFGTSFNPNSISLKT